MTEEEREQLDALFLFRLQHLRAFLQQPSEGKRRQLQSVCPHAVVLPGESSAPE